VDEALSSAQQVAQQYYRERQESVTLRASWLASSLSPGAIESGNMAALQATARGDLATMRDGLIELYQAVPTPAGERNAVFLLALEAGEPPRDAVRASADRIAARVAASGGEDYTTDDVTSGGVLVRAAAPIRNAEGVVAGVVVVSLHVPDEMNALVRVATDRYTEYKTLELLKAPLQGMYAAGGGRFVCFGGGVPLWTAGRVVGGVGVSGGTVEQDVRCAGAAAALWT